MAGCLPPEIRQLLLFHRPVRHENRRQPSPVARRQRYPRPGRLQFLAYRRAFAAGHPPLRRNPGHLALQPRQQLRLAQHHEHPELCRRPARSQPARRRHHLRLHRPALLRQRWWPLAIHRRGQSAEDRLFHRRRQPFPEPQQRPGLSRADRRFLPGSRHSLHVAGGPRPPRNSRSQRRFDHPVASGPQRRG